MSIVFLKKSLEIAKKFSLWYFVAYKYGGDMRYILTCLLAGVFVLVGCGTPPKGFAVSGVPVYKAENTDELFMGTETITMKFADDANVFLVGSIEEGKLTLSLPDSVPDELFDNPDHLVIENATHGLGIATSIFSPDIYLYDIFSGQNYRLFYVNKNGSFMLDNIKYNLTRGWNLTAQKDQPLINVSEIRRAFQYKWVCYIDPLFAEGTDIGKYPQEN
jgi:hypothetical protein